MKLRLDSRLSFSLRLFIRFLMHAPCALQIGIVADFPQTTLCIPLCLNQECVKFRICGAFFLLRLNSGSLCVYVCEVFYLHTSSRGQILALYNLYFIALTLLFVYILAATICAVNIWLEHGVR